MMQIDFMRDGECWRVRTWKDSAHDFYLAAGMLLPEIGWLAFLGWIAASWIL